MEEREHMSLLLFLGKKSCLFSYCFMYFYLFLMIYRVSFFFLYIDMNMFGIHRLLFFINYGKSANIS